ncbi:hypothetical protein U1E44_09815 [Arenibacter sp. GZD96]|uniref:hypothetical protein n=1 Tax=Aurantibrevibacter litoralis TaxID=3106030 RepID=UPI002AFF048B|nr:hypothetical protein [Arenibacter sp. GZD-96]MEA1786387.1 hypothetical protein [Arenibacter sp. GZD-96]
MQKKYISTALGTAMVLFLGVSICNAQTEAVLTAPEKITVQRLSFLERFEPEMTLTGKERLQKKKEHYALMAQQRAVIDTLSISNRKKKKLQKLVYRAPYSDRLTQQVHLYLEDVHP